MLSIGKNLQRSQNRVKGISSYIEPELIFGYNHLHKLNLSSTVF